MRVTFEKLREAVIARDHELAGDWTTTGRSRLAVERAAAIAGEAGAVAKIASDAQRGAPHDVVQLAHHLGALVVECEGFARLLGVSLQDAVAAAFNLESEENGSSVFLKESE